MRPEPFLIKPTDLNQAYHELDRITKLLMQRDLLLTESNLELEEKLRDLEEARRELVNTAEYLSNLLANSPDAIWVLDNHGQVVAFNPIAEEISGYRLEEVEHGTLDFLFEDAGAYHDLLASLPTQGSYRNLRTRIRRRNGETAELLMSLSLLWDRTQTAQPRGSITIVKDMTRELRLEEALREANERLEEKVRARTHDLEVLSQTLVVLNEVSRVASQSLELDTLLNNILSLVLELTGFHMGFISTLDEKQCLSLRAEVHLPLTLAQELGHLHHGQGFWGSAAEIGRLKVSTIPEGAPDLTGTQLSVAVPLRAKGKVQGVMGLMSQQSREILDEERDMLLAIGMQAGWAIENSRLYEQVRDDVVKLKEVDRIKTEFIATMSHEFRTPLTSIIGFLRYAEIARQKFEVRKMERYIHVALENGQKLSVMIEDLLAMQKLDSGTMRLNLESLNLQDLTEEIAEDLLPQLQQKHQSLVIAVPDDFPPDFQADREQLERVLTNLIINAVKFSEGPGTITVRADHDPVNHQIILRVEDTGIGMSPETREHIFERFYQAESALTRTAGGAGLGLTIAHRIVEMHGGNIKVESELQHGSRFIITLPERSHPAKEGVR